jgi:hypothetical protein
VVLILFVYINAVLILYVSINVCLFGGTMELFGGTVELFGGTVENPYSCLTTIVDEPI